MGSQWGKVTNSNAKFSEVHLITNLINAFLLIDDGRSLKTMIAGNVDDRRRK